MSEREFNKIFSERLRYYLSKYEITQLELSKRLGVGTTSVYNWCNGIKTPRMDKVDAMCKIFHCKRSDLMEDKSLDTKLIPIIPDYTTTATPEEFQHLVKKYRDLDDHGREMVDFTLQKEWERAKPEAKKNSNVVSMTATKSSTEVNAAHAMQGASDEDKQYDEDIMNDENF